MKVTRAAVAALALFALAAAVLPAAAQEVVNFYGFRFDDRLGPLKRVGVTEFEKDRPGFGYGIRYAATGYRVDIFVYDRGLKEIPPGVQSDAQKKEFALAAREIELARASGLYTEVKAGDRFETPAVKEPSFACQSFKITRKDRGEEDSVLCLGARNNKFFKVRISLSPPSSSTVSIAEGLLKEISQMAGF